jgi:anti-sigma B factor antagonist
MTVSGVRVSATPSFEVSVLPERAFVRVRPRGEIDLATAGLLDHQIQELWDCGWSEVVADLREVTFMDSSGLRVLVGHHRYAAEDGVRFSIIDGNGPVARVLELTGIDQVLDHTSVDRLR